MTLDCVQCQAHYVLAEADLASLPGPLLRCSRCGTALRVGAPPLYAAGGGGTLPLDLGAAAIDAVGTPWTPRAAGVAQTPAGTLDAAAAGLTELLQRGLRFDPSQASDGPTAQAGEGLAARPAAPPSQVRGAGDAPPLVVFEPPRPVRIPAPAPRPLEVAQPPRPAVPAPAPVAEVAPPPSVAPARSIPSSPQPATARTDAPPERPAPVAAAPAAVPPVAVPPGTEPVAALPAVAPPAVAPPAAAPPAGAPPVAVAPPSPEAPAARPVAPSFDASDDADEEPATAQLPALRPEDGVAPAGRGVESPLPEEREAEVQLSAREIAELLGGDMGTLTPSGADLQVGPLPASSPPAPPVATPAAPQRVPSPPAPQPVPGDAASKKGWGLQLLLFVLLVSLLSVLIYYLIGGTLP